MNKPLKLPAGLNGKNGDDGKNGEHPLSIYRMEADALKTLNLKC